MITSMDDRESGGVTRQQAEKFFSLEQPYRIQLSRKLGEANLADIARSAEREFCWAYDEDTSTWYYYPSIEHSESVSRLDGTSTFSVVIPRELVVSPSRSSVFYHTHPDSVVAKLLSEPKEGWHTEEFLRVSGQLPKSDDLEAAVRMRGYKEFRIVTSAGVTSYQFHPENLLAGQKTLPNLSIPQEELYKSLVRSFEDAVRKALDYMSEHYRGVFTFSFETV